jgi:ABC-2 type transport system permease protein
MNCHVLHAVFRRNFVSYFANPTGYLFICVFVILCALAAFWPDKFFNNNLANLDQLTGLMPLILLIFIPSITMGVWADERRQGTDELLLTIPASDFDVVLGKYLAAVLIFTASLVFSLLCNFCVLSWLGNPDAGLFLGTYFGYWLIGLAMLAIGMVASFLTGNLTVSYILGVAFNAPLVFAAYLSAVLVFSPLKLLPMANLADSIKRCSLGEQLTDFGRGAINLSSVAYFAVLAAAMLYLCMVLIGRRHWRSGAKGGIMVLHYTLRVAAMAVIAVGVTVLLRNYDVRWDTTAEGLNSLTPETRNLLKKMDFTHPVLVEAFISPDVPESYVQTRLNLLSMLREFETLRGERLQVVVHDTEPSSKEAEIARNKYGIEPREVTAREHGVYKRPKIFMHLVFSSGRERVPPIFFDRGIPIEYELIRSLSTVTQKKSKRIGVLMTDAQVIGRGNPMNPSASGNWPIIAELEKQYEVVSVDPAQPIAEKYDALLAVQPSSLGPQETQNFIAAVENGQPTAIFEDPLPIFFPEVAGTTFPRKPPGGMEMMMMMGQRNLPKGDLQPLWQFLGVNYTGKQIVWQKYNPYRNAPFLTDEDVIIDQGQYAGVSEDEAVLDPKEKTQRENQAAAGRYAFNPKDVISSGIQQLLLPYPGRISKRNSSDLEFIGLAETAPKRSGDILLSELMEMRMSRENPFKISSNQGYLMAAEIRGMVSAPASPTFEELQSVIADPAKKKTPGKMVDVHVVLVPDIDMLAGDFFRLREMGADNPDFDFNFHFDNVTFVLNALDVLAGSDPAYAAVRKHRPQHRTLERVEKQSAAKQEEDAKALKSLFEEVKKEKKRYEMLTAQKSGDVQKRKDIDQLQKEITKDLISEAELQTSQRALAVKQREYEQKTRQNENGLDQFKQDLQNRYKLAAVLFPPLLPLAVGIAVFFTRRRREKEGVDRARLR